jgi:hypothetical protein
VFVAEFLGWISPLFLLALFVACALVVLGMIKVTRLSSFPWLTAPALDMVAQSSGTEVAARVASAMLVCAVGVEVSFRSYVERFDTWSWRTALLLSLLCCVVLSAVLLNLQTGFLDVAKGGAVQIEKIATACANSYCICHALSAGSGLKSQRTALFQP